MVAIVADILNVDEVVRAVQSSGAGAIVTFQGTVRDNSQNHKIEYLEYEAYRPMAEREMKRIVEEAEQRFDSSCAALHRVGRLQVGETSVVVAAASPHRKEAFEAARFVIDSIKQSVPIWKKEVAVDGHWWVEDPLQKTDS